MSLPERSEGEGNVIDEKDGTWLADRIGCLLNDGEVAAAIRLLEEQSETEDPVQVIKGAAALNDAGESQVARRAAEIIVRRYPEFSLAHAYLGQIYLDQQDLGLAVESLSTAARLKPHTTTLTFLGVAYSQQNNVEEAISCFRQALDLDENYEEASYNLATLLAPSDPTEAKSLLRAAIHVDPQYGLAHRELGVLLNRQTSKRSEEAEAHLRRAVELMPEDPWARLYLGNCLYKRGRLHRALEEFKEAARIAPDESTPLWTAADIYFALGDVQTATEYNQRALEIDPDDPAALANMGQCLLSSGDLPVARHFIERSLGIDPDRNLARRLLAELERSENQST